MASNQSSRAGKRVLIHGPPELQRYLDSPGQGGVKAQIREMFRNLRENAAAGEHVKRGLWPDKYAGLGISAQVRLTYTIVDVDAGTRIVRILDFFRTLKEYERAFGYS